MTEFQPFHASMSCQQRLLGEQVEDADSVGQLGEEVSALRGDCDAATVRAWQPGCERLKSYAAPGP